MMKPKITPLLPALLLACPLAAQGFLVHPAPYASVEGETSLEWPFGSGRSWPTGVIGVRYQQVHDALSPKTVAVKGMAFRRDGKVSLPRRGWTVEMDLTLSTCPRPAYQILPEFDANIGKDAVKVVSRKKIHFPPFPAGWSLPKRFLASIPFDKGKSFVLRGGKSLCWEAGIYWSDLWKNKEGSLRFDASGRVEKIVSINYGHGCYAPGRTAPASMTFGVDPKRPWDLLPGVSNGPMLGVGILLGSPGQARPPLRAGGLLCRFYLDPGALSILSPILFLDCLGGLKNRFFYIPVPKDPVLRGTAFHAQWVFAGPNSMKTCFTNAAYVFIPYTWPDAPWRNIGCCVARGKRPDLLRTGIPTSYLGLVVRFRL